ncbi:MAG: DUF3127 domain-containing protein [Chryseobacterium sp.]|uniref:DUF3127 domain-containing protein n=1 Tax=Chryseobacterium sp. TaxID=1871047 RepID=UPI001B040794|nr:DUF3127 domain-containing protein [Chryseobacterium sp.]MBO6184221.1 DUF3127 domain-containing protein [Chryseobacterium sp.]
MDIYGTIDSRTPAEQKTETFRVQNFILDASWVNNVNGNTIENILEFQVTGNNIEKLEAIPDKSRVKVFFNPSGRMVEKKDGSGKFVAQNLNAYKFEILTTPPKGNANETAGTTTQGNVY